MRINQRNLCVLTAVWGVGLSACPVRAGIGGTGSYSNDTLTVNTAVSESSPYYVGDTGTNNVLTIQDGGRMTFDMTHWHGLVIGYGTGGDHNKVVVESGGVLTALDGGHDVWAVALGGRGTSDGGSYNELVVDGGTATNLNWIRIGDGGNVTGNVVRVLNDGLLEAGSGLLLSTRIGATQSGLEVASGGIARGADLRLGNDSDTGGNDWVHVHGGGTLELNDYVRTMYGANHLIHVYDEGELSANRVSIGYSAGVTNSVLRVDGSGSTVDITGELQIGRESGADHNAMLVTTGAQASAGNVVITHGTGNRLEIVGDKAAMEVTTDVVIGDSTAAVDATLVVTNGGQLTIGGDLNLRLSNSNFAHVTEDGEVTVGNHLYVGWLTAARGISMRVDHGGQVSVDEDMRIGHNSSLSEMVIDGTGTRVGVDGETAIGYGSASGSNTLTISNGGRLESTVSVIGRAYVSGTGARSSGNEALVTGTGSMWTNTGTLKVGGAGAYNSLFIENGGGVFSPYLVIGEEGHDNRLVIGGVGSTLDVSGNLDIAPEIGADRNVMLVTTGAQVNIGGDVLVADRGADNRLEISGAGAAMQVASNVWVGDRTSVVDTRLVVTNQGQLAVGGDLSLRQSDSNFAHVSEGGEVTVGNHLYVGWLTAGRDMSMRVDHGGQVAVDNDLYVGFNSSRSDLVIDGTGTRVGVDGETVIGSGSASGSNTLTISNGGLLESTASVIGRGYSAATGARSSGNEVLVTGAGSVWTNSGLLEISRSEGEGNILAIRDEGMVASETVLVQSGGIIELDGATLSLTGDGNALQVSQGGVLRGTGTIQADAFHRPELLIGGEVAPGFSTGTLTIRDADLTFGADAVVHMEIAAIDDFDRIVLEKTHEEDADVILTFNGTLKLTLLGGYEPQLHESFQLFMADSYLDLGMVIDDSDAGLPEGWSWQLNDNGSVSVIPEAATTGTMLMGLAFIFACRRRRARA